MKNIVSRYIFLIISAIIIFTGFDTSVSQGAAIVTSGTCGVNLTWTLDSDGVLRISGEGEMYDFGDTLSLLASYNRKSVTEIVIEYGVESIGKNAFYGSENLRMITIASSVKKIKTNAFLQCYLLKNIFIPAYVEEIQPQAFDLCTSLTSIKVSPSNKTFKSEDGILFSKDGTKLIHCPLAKTGLQDYVVPDGVQIIDDYAFYDNKLLQTITFPSSLTTILGNAFTWCTNLKEISFPPSVTYIGYRAFSYCHSLKTVSFPAALGHMSPYAFSTCRSLETVKFPYGITEIADSAFSNCKALKYIYIPTTVTDIQTSAFSDCSGITDVYYGGSEYGWNHINYGDFNIPYLNLGTVHYNYPYYEPNFFLPDGLTEIDSKAFSGIKYGVFKLPKNVTYIAPDAFDATAVLLVPSKSSTETAAKGLNAIIVSR